MVSAQVTRADPYTVTYQIRPEASWADNAPIAAEDFVYLWQQLRGAPDAINGAGYRLISGITAHDAGKQVEVSFTKPYPGWRSLFDGLVPAHLLKDAPGGWAGALKDSFPTTGGPFSIKTLDRDRGEIVLERNDRYWEKPPALDRIILRRADQSGVIDALRAGRDQLALIQPDSAGVTKLGALGGSLTVATVPRPTVATVLLRPIGPDLTVLGVRQAVAALLNRALLSAMGTGGGPSAKLMADAQSLPPSAPGYAATLPATSAKPDKDRAEHLLTEAGYVKTGGVWLHNGRQLSLTVGAPTERPSYVAMANEVGRELVAEGVEAHVVTMPAANLVTQLSGAQPGGAETINVVVASQFAGGDPATTLATNFGCESASDTSAATAVSPFGVCDPAVQPIVEAAVTGSISITDALSTVEPAMWRLAESIPLYQEADSLAIRPEMSGVSAGPAFAGPFLGASQWRRAAG
jgi:ABC-type transport system substrate-binding protein